MAHVVQLQRNTARYEFADGIRDFHHAFWVLVTGIYAWIVWGMPSVWGPFAEYARSQGIVFTILTTFVLPIGIPLIISQVGLRLVNDVVRRRWLWRNTGFIKPKSWIVPRRVLLIGYVIALGMFIGGIVLVIQTREISFFLRGLYAGVGLALAYMYLNVGLSLELPRYRIVAIVGAISTVVIALLPLSAGMVPAVMSLFWVALLVVSGIYGMMQVAQQQKAADDEA